MASVSCRTVAKLRTQKRVLSANITPGPKRPQKFSPQQQRTLRRRLILRRLRVVLRILTRPTLRLRRLTRLIRIIEIIRIIQLIRLNRRIRLLSRVPVQLDLVFGVDEEDPAAVQVLGEALAGVGERINGELNLEVMSKKELEEYAIKHFNYDLDLRRTKKVLQAKVRELIEG